MEKTEKTESVMTSWMGLELRAVELVRADAVRGHLEAVFEEGDPPSLPRGLLSRAPRCGISGGRTTQKVMKMLEMVSNRTVSHWKDASLARVLR